MDLEEPDKHAKWLEASNEVAWRAKVASLNLLITALVCNRPSEVRG
jgi:phosphoketolase